MLKPKVGLKIKVLTSGMDIFQLFARQAGVDVDRFIGACRYGKFEGRMYKWRKPFFLGKCLGYEFVDVFELRGFAAGLKWPIN